MELTYEILKKNGFKTNHEERVFPTYYCYSAKSDANQWRIVAIPEYLTLKNTMTYNIEICKWNEKGAIIKNCTITDIRTTDEVNILLNLCGINKELA